MKINDDNVDSVAANYDDRVDSVAWAIATPVIVSGQIEQGHISMGLRGNPKGVDFFVMQEESRRVVSSTTLRLLC